LLFILRLTRKPEIKLVNKMGSTFFKDNMVLDAVKVKLSRYRPGVAHRVGRGIALLFHDRGTGRG